MDWEAFSPGRPNVLEAVWAVYSVYRVLEGVLISTYLAGWPRVTHDMVPGLPRANLHLFACECGSGRACEMTVDAGGRAGER